MAVDDGIGSVIVKNGHADFHLFLQHLVKVIPCLIFFAQLNSLLLQFGHSLGFSDPHLTDHVYRQTPQINEHLLISTVPPSTIRCFELIRKSATFLWADPMMLPKVWREMFIRSAACS
jgi:hypothetical protein